VARPPVEVPKGITADPAVVSIALNVKLSHVSKSAREKIEVAGGNVEVVQ
jgi:ribosomal protein L15